MPLPLPGGPNRTALIPFDGVSNFSFGNTSVCGGIFYGTSLTGRNESSRGYHRGNTITSVRAAVDETESPRVIIARYGSPKHSAKADACVSKSAVGESGLCPEPRRRLICPSRDVDNFDYRK